MTPSVSPFRRALNMTAIFAGPGFLILFLFSAFFGALQPMTGAKEILREREPESLVISINAGGDREGKPMQRSYLLVPASFREKAMFIVSRDELSQLSVSHSSLSAFNVWASIMALALALSVFVSAPMLWQIYRPHPALVADSGLAADADAEDEDHAQL
ncbi:MAG: hypothetical protein O3C21_02390 [Verrucomicrobia bacterium]|nr:hypothetical protein [Verrucomicrobiota bacterium]